MVKNDGKERLHALDNLRAVLMWLGIVLHVCINHLVAPSHIPWKDPQVTQGADLAVIFIHSFRMPAFYILAGILAAMLVASHGVRGMVRNRLRRIALPFVVFWPVIFALTMLLALVFFHLMAHGTLGFDPAVAPKKGPGGPLLLTLHLWFLYYLFWFCMLAAALVALARHLPPSIASQWQRLWNTLAAHWWGVVILAVPLALAGSGYRAGMLTPNASFIPNLPELVHNGMFFVFGWTVYRQRTVLLMKFAAHYGKYLAAGSVSFVATLMLFSTYAAEPDIRAIGTAIAFVYGLTSWLWSIGLLGLFVQHMNRQNAFLRYLSDSSYWVFMVHMLGTIGFGALLFNAPLGAAEKIAVNVAATTLMCLASYHWLVRGSWIGVLLNGRRHGPPAGTAPGSQAAVL